MDLRVDASASEPHYLRHALPVWLALPVENRGLLYTDGRWRAQAHAAGVPDDRIVIGTPPGGDTPTIVASHNDLHSARPRPVIFVEHGAGQRIDVQHPSWAGGNDREGVVLYIAPNDHVAERNAQGYPGVPTAVVGCPALDGPLTTPYERHDPPVVALTFHWRCQVSPEQAGTFDYWARGLPALARRRFTLLGHAHPREWAIVEPHYTEFGIEPVKEWGEVIERADVLVVDNSSTAWEWCALDRPLVLLNAPQYRLHMDLWPRFGPGNHADAGVACYDPGDLAECVEVALSDPQEARDARRRAAEAIYAYRDGTSAQRAADAILLCLTGEREIGD